MTNLLAAVQQNLKPNLPEANIRDLDLAKVAVNFRHHFGISFDEFWKMKLCRYYKLTRILVEMKPGGNN